MFQFGYSWGGKRGRVNTSARQKMVSGKGNRIFQITSNKLSKIDIYIMHLTNISHFCRCLAIFTTINLPNSNKISNFATTLKNNLEHYEY